MRSGELAVLLR